MKMNKNILLCVVCLLASVTLYAQSSASSDSLRVSILGDSYSTFEGYLQPDTNLIWYYKVPQHKNDVNRVEQTWWYQVMEQMAWKLEVNNSYSGSTICYTGYNGEDYASRAFITRLPKLGEPDVILVCGATNDSWAKAPVGEYQYGGWSSQALYTFRPAMAKLCADLRQHYPMARVYFILNTGLRPEINESVHTICRHYGIPCIDLHDIHCQQGHPSVKGMQSIADQVVRFINNERR